MGEKYWQGGNVEMVSMRGDHAHIRVLGSLSYAVQLGWDEVSWDGGCDCPSFVKWGPCKHLFAGALAVADKFGVDTAALGEIPEEVPAESAGAAAWRDEVRLIATSVTTNDIHPDIRLDLVLSPPTDVVSEPRVVVLERKREGGGPWGKPGPLDLADRGLADFLDPDDRELMQLLQGAGGKRLKYNWRSAQGCLELPGALADILLPKTAARGRLFLLDFELAGWGTMGDFERNPGAAFSGDYGRRDGGAGLIPITCDTEVAWTQEAHVVELGSQSGTGARLVSRYRRDEEVLESDGAGRLWSDAALFLNGLKLSRFAGTQSPILGILSDPSSGPTAPPEETRDFVVTMAGILGRTLHSGPGLEWLDTEPTPALELYGMGEPDLNWHITAAYGEERVSISKEDPRAMVVENGGVALRAREVEAGFVERFVRVGGTSEERDPEDCAGKLAHELFAGLCSRLISDGWQIWVEGLRVEQPSDVVLDVSTGTDWFDLSGGVEFNGQIIPIPALLVAARDHNGLVLLEGGGIGLLPTNWAERWEALELGTAQGERLRFHASQGPMLDMMLTEREENLTLTADADFMALRKKVASFTGPKPLREAKGFKGTLRAYQQEGLGWLKALRDLGLGGCLADEMGLGKTVQILAHLQKIKGATKAADRRPSLVVMPRSLAFQWMAEAERFTPNLVVADHRGASRWREVAEIEQVDVLLTTYGTLRNDAELLSKVRFDTVILDEATAIKNATSQSAKAARLLVADHRIALSGTPVENSLGELWSLFEFLNPGMLGKSTRFRDLMKRSVKAPSKRPVAVKGEQVNNFLCDVQRAVSPFLLRRRKEDVLKDLPKKTVETLYVELGSKQRREYDKLKEHFRSELLKPVRDAKDLSGMHMHVLEALLRLRQASCHLGLLDESKSKGGSAKLDVLFEQLQPVLETEGRKALIFSQFTTHLSLLGDELKERNIPFELLTGRTTKREKVVSNFQANPGVRLFLISLKAGGHGLNLTAADTVFLLDPWWNPAVEAQAIDRSHRSGQTRPVFAYRLIARDTVEEKVLALQARKQALSDAVLGSEASVLASLTREELAGLL